MKGKIAIMVLTVVGLLGAVKAEAGWLKLKPMKMNPRLESPIKMAPLVEEAPLVGVRTVRTHYVACENCTGPGGASQVFQCPVNYVLTGIEAENIAWGETDCEFGLACGGSLPMIIHGMKVSCSPLGLDRVESFISETLASTFLEGDTLAGTMDGSEPRQEDQCAPYTGIANGLFGSSGNRLDGVGLFCGRHFREDLFKVSIESSDIKANTGILGGVGGHPFSVKCGDKEAMVGVQLRSGSDVDGVEGIVCAEVEGVR
jgi:hypothetical protein